MQGTNLTKAKRLESFFFEDFCLKARFGISRSRGQTHFKNSGILPICFWDVLGLCLAEFKSHVSSSVDDWIRTVPGWRVRGRAGGRTRVSACPGERTESVAVEPGMEVFKVLQPWIYFVKNTEHHCASWSLNAIESQPKWIPSALSWEQKAAMRKLIFVRLHSLRATGWSAGQESEDQGGGGSWKNSPSCRSSSLFKASEADSEFGCFSLIWISSMSDPYRKRPTIEDPWNVDRLIGEQLRRADLTARLCDCRPASTIHLPRKWMDGEMCLHWPTCPGSEGYIPVFVSWFALICIIHLPMNESTIGGRHMDKYQ